MKLKGSKRVLLPFNFPKTSLLFLSLHFSEKILRKSKSSFVFIYVRVKVGPVKPSSLPCWKLES